MSKLTVIHGDCLEELRKLPAESVQMCVTSPPYFGLRSYLPDGHPDKVKELGSEETPKEFVAKMVEVFEEVRRVLRTDGTVFLNLGDSYAREGGTQGGGNRQCLHMEGTQNRMCKIPEGSSLKVKDLIGIPWRVAFAMQDAGWYLRQWMPWVKRNALPESVTDRPSTTCETVFLLTKNAHYFYDGEAVKMPASPSSHARLAQNVEAQIGSERANGGRKTNGNMKAVGKVAPAGSENRNNASFASALCEKVGDRNRRQGDWFFESNWQGMVTDDDGWPLAMVVNPKGYRGAHFATFPERLVRPCILAGTSQKGACPTCGAPWERIVETTEEIAANHKGSSFSKGKTGDRDGGDRTQDGDRFTKRTAGWRPTCECNRPDVVPCVVLDIFGGSGTSGKVALSLGRDCTLIELNGEYLPLIAERTNTAEGDLAFHL